MTREEMRRYAREEAEAVGLFDEDTVDAIVDMAVGNAMSDLTTGEIDADYFEELVAGVIQGHAAP